MSEDSKSILATDLETRRAKKAEQQLLQRADIATLVLASLVKLYPGRKIDDSLEMVLDEMRTGRETSETESEKELQEAREKVIKILVSIQLPSKSQETSIIPLPDKIISELSRYNNQSKKNNAPQQEKKKTLLSSYGFKEIESHINEIISIHIKFIPPENPGARIKTEDAVKEISKALLTIQENRPIEILEFPNKEIEKPSLESCYDTRTALLWIYHTLKEELNISPTDKQILPMLLEGKKLHETKRITTNDALEYRRRVNSFQKFIQAIETNIFANYL